MYYECSVAQRNTNFFKHSLTILEMGRPSYVCTVCSEHFTRKYSATRHNHNLHNGAAEIVRLIDYLAGRSSGQYTPNNPFWFKRHNPYDDVGSSVADSVGDAFQPRYIPQQTPLGTSQNGTNPMHTIHDQRYGNSFSETTTTKLKIDELKRLMNKYPKYHNNDPDVIIQWAIHSCLNGDNTFLDDKLEQLRTMDRRLNGWS
jgi:hypothetical protein